MTSEVKVITKRIDTLKVSENEIVDAPDGTGEITQIFIETTELEVSIQEVLSKTWISVTKIYFVKHKWQSQGTAWESSFTWSWTTSKNSKIAFNQNKKF